MMKAIAIYKGATSYVYKNGNTYELKIHASKGITISRLGGGGKKDYESLKQFLENWKIINNEKKD